MVVYVVNKLLTLILKAKSKGSHRSRLQSPLSNRRQRYSRAVDSSDDEVAPITGDDVTTCENYRNLETFQKAQLNKKVILCSEHLNEWRGGSFCRK